LRISKATKEELLMKYRSVPLSTSILGMRAEVDGIEKAAGLCIDVEPDATTGNETVAVPSPVDVAETVTVPVVNVVLTATFAIPPSIDNSLSSGE
jgi:hypothetical protein